MASLLIASWAVGRGARAKLQQEQLERLPSQSPKTPTSGGSLSWRPSVPHEPSLPEGPPIQRQLVFIVFVLVAQAMMSYDGGATTMSTAALLQQGWTVDMLGWLGAMDKFGQVASALLWGMLLERLHDPKWLIWVGLVAKAASCFSFAVLTQEVSMLTSKFSMGAWEALIGTWGTLWVNAHAPKGQQVAWNTLFNVMAGMGNAFGAVMAGFTADHLGYGFAFKLQAALLMAIVMMMVPVRAKWFSTKEDTSILRVSRGFPYQPAVLVNPPVEPSKPSEQGQATLADTLRMLWFAPWLGTAMGISLTCFVQSGANMLWQNTTMHVWGFSPEAATMSNLLVCGIGAAVGVVLGPKLFDNLQPDSNEDVIEQGRQSKCLAWSFGLGVEAAAWSAFAASLLCLKAHEILVTDHGKARSPVSSIGWILVSVLIAIFLVVDLLQSMQGVLAAINNDCLPVRLQPRGAAIKLIFQNIFGYAAGMVLPSIVAARTGDMLLDSYPYVDSQVIEGAQFCVGMASSLLMCLVLTFFLAVAWWGGRAHFRAASSLSDALSSKTKPLLSQG